MQSSFFVAGLSKSLPFLGTKRIGDSSIIKAGLLVDRVSVNNIISNKGERITHDDFEFLRNAYLREWHLRKGK